MNNYLHTIPATTIDAMDINQSATPELESGKVVYFPQYALTLETKEHTLLSPTILDGNRKNISYDYQTSKLAGATKDMAATPLLQQFMQRYALFAKQLIDVTLPQYSQAVRWGRTSYRPAEIKGRAISKRKDDTRLHVDSFPSTPVNGLRILRVFCNINPQQPRVWHLGEPFPQVLQTFASQLPRYSKTKARFLKTIQATKTLRSAYDHYMLHLHDTMKLDDQYQANVPKYRMDFPAQTSWIVFTDQVSHAALSGQFLLEQTFYLPVDAMADPDRSPLRQLESIQRRI